MPHIVIEYSANLEDELAPMRLVEALHAAALETGVFPLAGLRTRAERRELYRIADGDPDHIFIAVSVRIGEGRDAATRRRVADVLMAVLERETAKTFQRRGLALSLDVAEIDGTASLKTNNLHHRLKARAKP
ncbi:5-carboxymethyl-2-hydroxymuconate isomerase [Bosea sp. 62]|uniref:5-carboxymethyl-2-hydroxymuconate isomerase n=1 Tax=unclassified Bosea (in: a-proteobacteria) TaxID=2653178 RepID=UPI00125AA029|nr:MULTISPECIES: 5-carboxymethyl-2-hydroxymuconate isomerase [unclassified Bosea (in: a-proteobacteria)]CAD5260032.1 5-carboxymethyl-2-hydroxymuconate isomerase [Bosea sp. 7B]CAD5272179.1 5-carboxymethyl-2-hydroxymuconate isomerase [Bosea sp. 21B]CAD5274400.1 5-carboxymethyl-2-hydroxymuconate isomerase [Bosea sp. 46]VVT59290.1 5-carboxymethyl-2-hydroxymuconate isomerase [Bosea sp. EC-HK365B]VXC26219.1 5-carboxymethyl-2-hydroxymuconate isomerase [Bosea sp. 127]